MNKADELFCAEINEAIHERSTIVNSSRNNFRVVFSRKNRKYVLKKRFYSAEEV